MARRKYVEGVVREWKRDEGFGTIESPSTPGGCGAVFVNISMEGFRTLRQGQRVRFTFVKARQDDCPFQALDVIPID